MLSDNDLDIIFSASKKSPTDAQSYCPNYARVLEGLCAATVLIVHCNTMFCLCQLYTVAIQSDGIFKVVLPNKHCSLIFKVLAEDHTVKETSTIVCFPSGFVPKNLNILVILF